MESFKSDLHYNANHDFKFLTDSNKLISCTRLIKGNDSLSVYIKRTILLLLICFANYHVKANITIDSVSTTQSICANNGTATVYAFASPNPFLLYAIVAGPVSSPVQSSGTFYSLYPGTYTMRVYDNNFDSLDRQFTVPGTYRLPYLNPTFINPTCAGFSDGVIKCNPDTSRGRKPFTYQIISPIVSAVQTTPEFTNLYANSYVIRMTDDCGNYQTRTVTLTNSGTGLSINGGYVIPYIQKTGCDTMIVSYQFYISKEKGGLPLTLNTSTSFGNTVKSVYAQPLDTINYAPGLYMISDTIYGLTYGDYLFTQISDTCGQTLYTNPTTIAPFNFDLIFYNSEVNCNVKLGANFMIRQYPYYPYIPVTHPNPSSFTLTNVATGAIVDSMSCPAGYCGLYIKPQTQGVLYHLIITDACGDVFSEDIQWPTIAAPVIYCSSGFGCLDSAASLYFNFQNFLSIPTIQLLSGPSYISSTKHGYEWSDTLIYPQSYQLSVYGGAITNLPAGTYQYLVTDSCGNSFRDSVTITTVNDFSYSYYFKRGCLGTNTLFINAQSPASPMAVACYIRDSTGNVIYFKTYMYDFDSISSLAPGKYAVEIFYGQYSGGGTYFDTVGTRGHDDCWVLHDTIVIPPIQTTSFTTNNTIRCNGTAYVQLQVDSNSGVPPYTYEIISGPQVYTTQDSSFFQISSFGNYVIRIGDACGNSNIQQISVDSAGFPPLVKTGSLCPGNKIVLSEVSSAYFSYEWHLPDGTIRYDDSIVINPLTAADTGNYIIYKIVSINGCSDTLFSSYHISFHDVFAQNISVCTGDSVHVGLHYYSLPGTYTDSLKNISGCDSIIITTLSLAFPDTIQSSQVICYGDSIAVGNHYYSSTGIYTDTIHNASGCRDLIITNLNVKRIVDSITVSICAGDSISVGNNIYKTNGIYNDTLLSALGCDSVIILNLTVNPYKINSLNKTICAGESFTIGTNTYNTTGIYKDTLSTSTCDSIVTLNLVVNPYKRDSINRTICAGETFTIGTNSYNTTGIYKDTLSTSTCDSIVTLSLTVNPYKTNSLNKTICAGESFTIGTNNYNTTGIYKDTLSTSTCDSIVTLSLTVNPYKTNSLNKTICAGESFTIGTNNYNTTGIYKDTLSTSTCDSIVTLSLTVNPYKRDSINRIICAGETFTIGTNTYTTTGIYKDTISTSTCDSIVTLNLVVNPYKRDSINRTICAGETFTIGTNTYTTTGIYKDTLSTSTCDSIVTLNLVVNPYKRDSINRTICAGENFTVGTNTYTVTGIYRDTLATSACDSIVTLNLIVNAYKRDSLNRTICAGESFTVGNHTYNQTGVYNDTLSTSACDSIVTLNLMLSAFKHDSITVTLCTGENFSLGNNIYNQAGIYKDTLPTATCDSIVTLNISYESSPSINITAASYLVTTGTSVQLNATVLQNLAYSWTSIANFNDAHIPDPTATIDGSSWIFLQAVSTNSCIYYDSLYIEVKEDSVLCEGSSVFIPNVFTPNGDGKNETFKASGENIIIKQMQIYNRWGAKIFETNDSATGWDGSYRGEVVSAVYVVLIEFNACNQKKPYSKVQSLYLLK